MSGEEAIGRSAMSVEDMADENEGEAALDPIGTDFKSDLVRVGQTVQGALGQNSDDPREVAASMADHFEAEGIEPADAVMGAWFYILAMSE